VAIALTAQVQQWTDRIDALELRERILLLAATIVVLYLLVDSLGLQPILKAQQVSSQEISGIETELGALQRKADIFKYKSDQDPLAERQENRDRLASELAGLDDRIIGQLGALVEPAQAAEMLEQVLTGHRGLKLKSLQASSEPLTDMEIGDQESGGLGRYQIEMVVEGGYLDLLRYLQELEAMPWKFFWQEVDFQTGDYPRAETRLQLYTLGAQNG